MTVKLTVKDEGPGMTIEKQEKLFQNFAPARPGQVQKGGGAGLGLLAPTAVAFMKPSLVQLVTRVSAEACPTTRENGEGRNA